MTEKQAQKIMEKVRDSGSPLPNIAEYSEALKKTYEILGSNYTEKQLDNWILVGKYPFLLPTYWNRETMQYEVDKDYTYKYTELDAMPDGWRIAFGEMMCEELKEELAKFNYVDKYRFIDIKEKWGGLDITDNGVPVGCDVWRILEKYRQLSENICIICGKPDVPMTYNGWDSPYCKKCFTTPSDWYKKEYPNEVNKWVKNHLEDWEEYNKEENNKMRDSYTIIKWSKEKGDETITYDISETANKIREKWKAEHGKD